jgi:hypothetical protein
LKDADALREAKRDVPWLLNQNGKDPSLIVSEGLMAFLAGFWLRRGVRAIMVDTAAKSFIVS